MHLRAVVFLILSVFLTPLNGQECNSFFPLKAGSSFELTSYDKKDKLEGVSHYEVLDRTMSGGTLEIEMRSTLTDKKGEEVFNSDYMVRCEDGTFYFDVTSMMAPQLTESFRNMEVTVEADEMALPSNLEVGQELPDANTQIKMNSSGFSLMSFQFTVMNRTVDAKESLTTPAGTFDCYKISYDMDMKVGIRQTMSVTEWYAKDVGLVRSETYNKKGKLTGYSVLTAYETP